MTEASPCPRCLKTQELCVCEGIARADNRVALIVLQHPQEQDVDLGSARLALLHVKNGQLKVGLSWPSLAKAIGRAADPKRWGVLYMGPAKPSTTGRDLVAVDRKGAPLPDQDEALDDLQGIIVLDGTWTQAKTLWWRNPWMLKCRRIVLNARRPSRYGRLRREPRAGSLSTLEAAAFALSRLEDKPEIEQAMVASFEKLLARYRANQSARPSSPTA